MSVEKQNDNEFALTRCGFTEWVGECAMPRSCYVLVNSGNALVMICTGK